MFALYLSPTWTPSNPVSGSIAASLARECRVYEFIIDIFKIADVFLVTIAGTVSVRGFNPSTFNLRVGPPLQVDHFATTKLSFHFNNHNRSKV